jgi:hypothetical protein
VFLGRGPSRCKAARKLQLLDVSTGSTTVANAKLHTHQLTEHLPNSFTAPSGLGELCFCQRYFEFGHDLEYHGVFEEGEDGSVGRHDS